MMCCISPRTQRVFSISHNRVPSVLRAVLLGREKEGRCGELRICVDANKKMEA